MAFWNSNRIRRECQSQDLITPYRDNRINNCAYELGVGDEAFITSGATNTTLLPPGGKVVIPAGQFGMLITREVVAIPNNAIAFISIRARVKFKGLVNVSGFHVDPGFRGQLKFAVYNAGSQDIILDQDEQVFIIWFADLDAATPDPRPSAPCASNIISAEDVSRLQGDVASPGELKRQLRELRSDLEKKIHVVEQSKLLNRTLILMVCAGFVTLLVTAFIRPYFEKTNIAAPATDSKTSIVTSAKSEPAIDSSFLGMCIVASGVLTSISVLGAAVIIVKNR